jgi:hypothetical protein
MIGYGLSAKPHRAASHRKEMGNRRLAFLRPEFSGPANISIEEKGGY